MVDSDDISDLEDAAVAAASTPAEVESDGQRAKARPLSEILDARDRLAGNAAAGLLGFGLRIQRIKPGDCG